MVFNIYDTSLNLVGSISEIVSSTWEEKYCDVGKCQLVVNENKMLSELMQVGYFVGCSTQSTLWQIKSKQKESGAIWLNGFTSNYSILSDRIYSSEFTSSKVETSLHNAVMANRPADIVGESTIRGLSKYFVAKYVYEPLFDICKSLCESVGYGFRFIHDKTNKKLLFDVYEGQDVSAIKFSEKFGNLNNAILKQSDVDYKNVAFVGGGSDNNVSYVICGDVTSSGMNRHEMFVRASSIKKEASQTEEEYYEILKQHGLQKLNETNKKLCISFDVSSSDFGTLFNLGDKITCILQDDMIKLQSRIIGFTEVCENNITTTSLEVGSPILQTIGR